MPIIEILLFTLTILAGVFIVWGSFKSGVSPMPSSKKARQAMIQLASEAGEGSIYDLGSGWGHLVIRLALKYPERQIVAYELSILPWLTTKVLKQVLGLKNLELYREDFLKADLSNASVIMCYLFPDVMTAIKNKLEQEEGKTHFLISNNFALPSRQAIKTIRLTDFYKSPVYLYQMSTLDTKI